MRQVDLDELTYHIFSGLRAWTPSVRARLFAPIAKRHDVHLRIAAQALAARMGTWTILDPATAEAPIEVAQLEADFVAAMLAFPGAIAALWASRQHEREREAQAAAAALLSRALDRYEILTETSLGPHGARVVWFRTPEPPAHAFAEHWP